MTPRHVKITEPSTRSPRTAWRRPRPTVEVVDILERNGFFASNTPIGVAYVRVVGIMALRLTIAHDSAMLETAQRMEGHPVRWRRCSGVGSAPWQVAGEALEYLTTLSVDTPVLWG